MSMDLMERSCFFCAKLFECTELDYQFLEKISPTFAGTKYQIPSPTLCPDCRQQRRLSFRNERNLYRRKCDASGKDIISVYSPDKPYKVYDQKIRWSDDRDPMRYGRDFDFEKNFTENFESLAQAVPYPSMLSINSDNCDYTCYTLESKECYMSSGVTKSEKVIYSYFVRASDSMSDCTMTYESSYCYECVDCLKLYDCSFCLRTIDSSSCIMCEDCLRCNHCIACAGLEDKSYYYKNEFIGQEAYEKLINNLSHSMIQQFREDLEAIRYQFPKKFANIVLSENVSGDGILASKNCDHCFDIKDCEDCKYVYFTPYGRTSQDCVYTAPLGVEYCYDVCSSMGTNSAFTFINWRGSNIYYSQHCHSCSDCFGCIGLRNKQYCIFNKQYTKDEYEQIVGTIIAHMIQTNEWGEFFHPSLSHFGYNETIAQAYYPLTSDDIARNAPIGRHCERSEAIQESANGLPRPGFDSVPNGTRDDVKRDKNGYKRSDYLAPIPQVDKVIRGQDLPETILEVTEDFMKVAILCEVTNKPFRIVPQELVFYRKHGIPLPRRHPDQRHLERMKLRNQRKLFQRKCDKCGDLMQTPFSPEIAGKVYCEKCYGN